MVAGFAKLNDEAYFSARLRATGLLPARSIRLASKIIPCFEIFFATILISGAMPVPVALVNPALFTGFLVFKLVVSYRRLSADCGCLGSWYQHKIDTASITVSAILVTLGVIYLWMVTWPEPAHTDLRLVVLVVFLILSCVLSWRIIQRQRPELRVW